MGELWTGCCPVRKVSEKLSELSGSKDNDQWFEICVMASYEKHASEDNTGIDTVQSSLVAGGKRHNILSTRSEIMACWGEEPLVCWRVGVPPRGTLTDWRNEKTETSGSS